MSTFSHTHTHTHKQNEPNEQQAARPARDSTRLDLALYEWVNEFEFGATHTQVHWPKQRLIIDTSRELTRRESERHGD